MLNKKTIVGLAVLSLSTVSAVSYAAADGAYFGAQLGYGNVHQKQSTPKNSGYTSFSSKDAGLAGRLSGGYQINSNFAGELGWTKFTNAQTKGSYKDTYQGLSEAGSYGVTIKTNAVDLVAKGIYPVGNNVNVYGKAGVAYVMQHTNYNGSYTSGSNKTQQYKGSYNNNAFLPTVGAGVSYDFSPNVAADLSYNRIQKTGSTNIKSTDLVAVGLTYSIG